MRHSRRLFLTSLAACLAVVGSLAAIGLSAGASTASVRPSAAQRAAAAARAAVGPMVGGRRGTGTWGTSRVPARPVRGVMPAAHRIGNLTMRSGTNWAGYVDTTGPQGAYTGVTGSWDQPAVACTATDSYAASWVGMDGFGNSTTESAGTLAQCYDGVPHYYTWWEMAPTTGMELVGSTIRPGDVITASVTRSGAEFTLQVTDATHPDVRLARRVTGLSNANNFVINQACNGCTAYTIEWIIGQPDPWDSSEGYAVPDFESWTLYNAIARAGSYVGTISSNPDSELTMVDPGGNIMIQPGYLTGSGGGFTDTFVNGM